jgi:predicted nuclease with TOPRIM domain
MEKKATTLEDLKPRLTTGEEFLRLMEKVFFIIKISIEETNPEKRYLIEKLAQMNSVAEKMLDNLKELVEVSSDLSENIPDAASKEYSKVILRKITARIESLHQENISIKETLAGLSEVDKK